MLFNTLDFAVFLPLVFFLYWFITYKNLKLQNTLIVVSSYVFYAWWDWRFLSLIIFSTIVDYFVGQKLKKEDNNLKRKILLWISIIINLSFLGFFKYYNFFLENFINAFSLFGTQINIRSLNIILPVGISFYTFQTLSYTVDIFRKKLEPTGDFIAFSAFVCFFPQLVAGPIERATNLLPQFYNKRTFKYKQGVQGLRLILWGMFKKVVIADSLAPMVNDVFENSNIYSGGTLWLGAIYFSIQIYCDFSGYSDIAIGTSKLFGFELNSNFKFPYFSRNIGEFWRRWHISLSTWFRDYLYIPLGGSKKGSLISLRNVFVIFLVSGFWHGANWTFIVWGLYHAILFIPSFVFKSNRRYNGDIVAINKQLPSSRDLILMLINFLLVTIGWVFFRSENLSSAFIYLERMFLNLSLPNDKLQGVGYILFFLIIDWFLRKDERLSEISKYSVIRYLFYLFLAFHVIKYFGLVQDKFIYFNF